MGKSPGHQEHPEHKVTERRVSGRMQALLGGDILADSIDVIEVDEDGYPPRYYFPRADAHMEHLRRSDTTSECPFKGTASYYALEAAGRKLGDAVVAQQPDVMECHSAPARKGSRKQQADNDQGADRHVRPSRRQAGHCHRTDEPRYGVCAVLRSVSGLRDVALSGLSALLLGAARLYRIRASWGGACLLSRLGSRELGWILERRHQLERWR